MLLACDLDLNRPGGLLRVHDDVGQQLIERDLDGAKCRCRNLRVQVLFECRIEFADRGALARDAHMQHGNRRDRFRFAAPSAPAVAVPHHAAMVAKTADRCNCYCAGFPGCAAAGGAGFAGGAAAGRVAVSSGGLK